jgi:multidrug resistance efflux pump
LDICDLRIWIHDFMAHCHDSGAYWDVAKDMAFSAILCRPLRSCHLLARIHFLAMISKVISILTTLFFVILAAWATWTLYQNYNENPWTRDCQVRANVVGIAPRVAGPLTQVNVIDNSTVKRGDLLFEIDPSDYKAELDIAVAQVATSEATLTQREQDMARQVDLFDRHVSSQQEYQNAQNSLEAAKAGFNSAKANEQVSRLKLDYTKVYAPVDGYVTNMNVSVGTYVNAGTQLMALVDTNSFWIAAYFKETQLSRIEVNRKARITLLGYERQSFEGVVDSIGWGIFVGDGATTTATNLLPTVSQTVDWVRLPQRFPVRLRVTGKTPVPLRIGQTVSASMQPDLSDEKSPHPAQAL